MEEIYDMTFSLTGVDDTEIDREEWINSTECGSEVTPLLAYSKKPSGLRDTFSSDTRSNYQCAIDQINGYALRQVRKHGHSINPGQDIAS